MKKLFVMILIVISISGCAEMKKQMEQDQAAREAAQPLGNNRFYIETEKEFFTMDTSNTQMFKQWDERASAACNGGKYKVIDRHLEQRQGYQPKLIGEIECQ